MDNEKLMPQLKNTSDTVLLIVLNKIWETKFYGAP